MTEPQYAADGSLVAATMEQAIEHVTRSNAYSTAEARTHALVALAQCFRVYCTAEDFFNLVVAQYRRASGSTPAQRNVVELLQRWVECGFNTDLLHNGALLNKLQQFVQVESQVAVPGVAQAALKVHQLAMLLSKQATRSSSRSSNTT